MRAGTALVDRIVVDGRYRRDLGDVTPLADSIAKVGLLHPVVVTSDLRLIAGQRRLEAVRSLGWREVDVRIADNLDAAVELLAAERDENTCRKDMTASELFSLGQALEDLERPKARERQAHGETAPGRNASGHATGSVEPRETREVVGDALGVSGTTYQRLKHIGQRASEGDEDATAILEAIDRGDESIGGGHRKLRQADIVKAPDVEPKRLSSTDRASQIAELAASGHRATQIADRLGIGVEHVRNLARRHDITLPDAALGKTRSIDVHHVVATTVASLEAEAFALEVLDLGDLRSVVEPGEADEWVASLSKSLRTLTSLRNRLKEATRVTA